MINDRTVLAVIPARGGSKGILRKNITEVAGKPLIAWTIEAARRSRYIDRLVLTSDDEEIMTVALQWGCEVPFRRPSYLAQDDTPGIAPVLHALAELPGYDYVVLLQPTSPLRQTSDIDACIECCAMEGTNCCVSVTEPDKSPYWMYRINQDGFLAPIMDVKTTVTRRQDIPAVYALNGAVYVAESEWLRRERAFLTSDTRAYIMPRERSVDIDTRIDIWLAELLLKQQ